MRRIELICKLIGPHIAHIDGILTEVTALVNLRMIVASVVVEYFAISQGTSHNSYVLLVGHHPKLPLIGLL